MEKIVSNIIPYDTVMLFYLTRALKNEMLPNAKRCTRCDSVHFEKTKSCKECLRQYKEYRDRLFSDSLRAEHHKQWQKAWRERNKDRVKIYRQRENEKRDLKFTENRRYNRLVKLLFEAMG